ncbi:hypothetical protein ACFU6S_32675 [Streptomyces sp. NPDC057456]|uniref:hypothetical protein n=1 Tax=Streptomyces sp. NPDC057456 TaxID=3346139 RepID=UPI00368966D4
MPATAFLARRPVYRRHELNTDPNRVGEVTGSTAAAATEEARAHLARDCRPRRIEVTGYGAVILRDGDRRIRFEPCADVLPKLLSVRMAEDLVLVGTSAAGTRLVAESRGLAVHAGFHRIPPAATNRLVRHGWLATGGGDGAAVAVSLGGVVALEWRSCKTTGVPVSEWADVIAEAVTDHFRPAG